MRNLRCAAVLALAGGGGDERVMRALLSAAGIRLSFSWYGHVRLLGVGPCFRAERCVLSSAGSLSLGFPGRWSPWSRRGGAGARPSDRLGPPPRRCSPRE